MNSAFREGKHAAGALTVLSVTLNHKLCDISDSKSGTFSVHFRQINPVRSARGGRRADERFHEAIPRSREASPPQPTRTRDRTSCPTMTNPGKKSPVEINPEELSVVSTSVRLPKRSPPVMRLTPKRDLTDPSSALPSPCSFAGEDDATAQVASKKTKRVHPANKSQEDLDDAAAEAQTAASECLDRTLKLDPAREKEWYYADAAKKWPLQPSSKAGRLIKKATLASQNAAKRREVTAKGGTWKSTPHHLASRAGKSSQFAQKEDFIPTAEQREQIQQDSERTDFQQGARMLQRETMGYFESFAANDPDSEDAIARKQSSIEHGTALRQWYIDNSGYERSLRKFSRAELTKDLYDMDSKFRKVTLELRKLMDQLELCHPEGDATGPFTSWAEDRCWPSMPGNFADYPAIRLMIKGAAERQEGEGKADDQIVQIGVHLLSLVEKLSVANDEDTLRKLYVVNNEGVHANKFWGIKNKDGSYEQAPLLAEFEASHLCEAKRGGCTNCCNPEHLVAETHADNMARQRCPGAPVLPNGLRFNLCRHGDAHGRHRCVGWWKDMPDLTVSRDQARYIPPFQTRKDHVAAKALFASTAPTLAAPAPVAPASTSTVDLDARFGSVK